MAVKVHLSGRCITKDWASLQRNGWVKTWDEGEDGDVVNVQYRPANRIQSLVDTNNESVISTHA